MKRSIVCLLVCPALLLCAGCANWWHRSAPGTYSRYSRPTTIALAITVDGVLQPTPQQYALVQAAAVRQFAALGYTIVTDLSLAERIVRIDFTPDPLNPDTAGRAQVLGFRSNPYYANAGNSIYSPYPYPTAFGFAGSFAHTNWAMLNNFGYGYYGYMNSYYDGYSYSSPSLNPVVPVATTPAKCHPPYRHDSNQCPPDMHRVKPLDGTFATNFTPVTPANYPPSSSRDRGHSRGGGGDPGGSYSTGASYASSAGGTSSHSSWSGRARSEQTASNASTSSSSSSRGSWWSSWSSRGSDSSSSSSTYSSSGSSYSSSSSSYSSPSYSSSGSSSSSSSYSGGSSSSSSGSSSSGSSGTQDSTSSRQQN